MAIARDSHATLGDAVTSSVSGAYANGGNLMVAFIYRENSATISTGPTYNGVAMSFVGTGTVDSYSPAHNVDCYVLVGPAAGSNTFAYTLSGSVYTIARIVTLSGCAQSGQPDGHNEATGSLGTSKSSNVTVTASNCWVVACGTHDNGGTITPSGVLSALDTTVAFQTVFDSNGTVATGSQSYGFSTTSSGGLGLLGVSIAPSTTTAYTLSASAGSFALTGVDVSMVKATAYSIACAAASFSLSGGDVTLSAPTWTSVAANAASWTDESAAPTAWTTA